MKILFISCVTLILSAVAYGFFGPLSNEERVKESRAILVIEVTKVDLEAGRSEAIVIQSLLGQKPQDRIEVWDDWQTGDDGSENRISGRDPELVEGKRYLIYLTKDAKGRYVTVQSSLDCLEIINGSVISDDGKKFLPLDEKISEIMGVLESLEAKEPKPEIKDSPTTETQ